MRSGMQIEREKTGKIVIPTRYTRSTDFPIGTLVNLFQFTTKLVLVFQELKSVLSKYFA